MAVKGDTSVTGHEIPLIKNKEAVSGREERIRFIVL
jgi:hypothetical protein